MKDSKSVSQRLRRTISIFLLLVFSLFSFELFSTPLKIAVDEWPPLVSSRLYKNGFSTDMVRQIYERRGFEVELIRTDFKDAIEGLKNGRYDILPAIWYRDDRQDKIIHTKAYFDSTIGVFSNQREAIVETNQLIGKRIGIVKNYSYPNYFKTLEGVKFIESESPYDNFKNYLDGGLDYFVVDTTVLKFLIKRFNLVGDQAKLYINHTIAVESIHVGISKKSERSLVLESVFNEEITEMKATGKFEFLFLDHIRANNKRGDRR